MRAFAFLTPLAALAACAGAPVATAEPMPGLDVGFEPATALRQPLTATVQLPARQLRITLRPADRPASAIPLDTRLEAVLDDDGAPFRASSPLLQGWFVVPGPEPAPGPEAGPEPTSAAATDEVHAETAVGAGFATRISFPPGDLPDLLLRRDGDRLQLGLRSSTGDTAGQLAVLTDAAAMAGPTTLLVARGAAERGVAIVLELGDEAPADLATRAVAAGAATATEPAAPVTDVANWAARLAKDSVGADPRRRSLLAVAARLGRERCIDLLLAAGETELIAIATAMPTDVDDPFAAERATWSALLPQLQRDEVPPAMHAALRRHLGALALDATALEFVLTTSPSLEEFEAAITAQNEQALDARRASQRIAAFDWLTATGRTLPGYDPLAPRQQRRAALRAAAAAAAEEKPR